MAWDPPTDLVLVYHVAHWSVDKHAMYPHHNGQLLRSRRKMLLRHYNIQVETSKLIFRFRRKNMFAGYAQEMADIDWDLWTSRPVSADARVSSIQGK